MTRIPTVIEPTKKRLTSRKLTDYTDYEENLLRWLSRLGKNPDKRKGYAEGTVRNVTYHIDRFYRWKWDQTSTYTTSLTPDEAEDYVEYLLLAVEGSRRRDAPLPDLARPVPGADSQVHRA